MSAEVYFYARLIASTIAKGAPKFIVERRVNVPNGPEAARTYVRSVGRLDVAQTQNEDEAARFRTFAEALAAVRVGCSGERAAANRLGLAFEEELFFSNAPVALEQWKLARLFIGGPTRRKS